MIKKFTIIAIFLSLFFVIESYADQNTLRLICKYSHTVDADGKSTPSSGEDLITVNYSDNGEAIIIKQGLGAEFKGTISDEKIYGKTEYKMSELKIQQTILINRYTGACEITFEVVGSSQSGLIHYGTCEPVSKKKF
jgi:hypothetical protein